MIGIFDSGFGGLIYAKNFNKVFPKYDFIYLGDQLRVPYGGRSPAAIQQFTEECVQTLWKLGAKLIILACNTASADALRYLQNKYLDKKILGVLIPGVEAALEHSGNIGVIATRGTIATQAYSHEIKKKDSHRKIKEVAAPLLVPLIEENYGNRPETKKILKKYLRPLKDFSVKNLILGCTHYAYIKNSFIKVMGKNVTIIDPGWEAVLKLKDYLKRHPEIDELLSKNSSKKFYTTDSVDLFEEKSLFFYGKKIAVEKIIISNF